MKKSELLEALNRLQEQLEAVDDNQEVSVDEYMVYKELRDGCWFDEYEVLEKGTPISTVIDEAFDHSFERFVYSLAMVVILNNGYFQGRIEVLLERARQEEASYQARQQQRAKEVGEKLANFNPDPASASGDPQAAELRLEHYDGPEEEASFPDPDDLLDDDDEEWDWDDEEDLDDLDDDDLRPDDEDEEDW